MSESTAHMERVVTLYCRFQDYDVVAERCGATRKAVISIIARARRQEPDRAGLRPRTVSEGVAARDAKARLLGRQGHTTSLSGRDKVNELQRAARRRFDIQRRAAKFPPNTAAELSAIAAASNVPITKLKPGYHMGYPLKMLGM